MSNNYGEFYQNKDMPPKRLCFSAAMIMFNPFAVISALNAPKSKPILLSSFTAEQLSEIEEYSRGYTDKPYVIEAKKDIYIVLPSMYPSSTACLLLRIDMKPCVLLRFIKEKPELFILSPNIESTPARMSKRLDAEQRIFLELCEDIERTYMGLERFNISFDDDETVDGYFEQTVAISNFLAVPIADISVEKSCDGVPIRSSFALFSAFCTIIMMLARNEAIDRKISVALKFLGGSALVEMSFKTDGGIAVTNETFLWDYLASDKKMLFEYYKEGDRFCVRFQPLFIDWSYLGIKQERNADMTFEE